MNTYYNSLILITLLTIVCMLINAITNRNISRKKRRYFIWVYALMFITTSCECIGTMTSGIARFSIILLISKFLEFSITPYLSIICSLIFQTKSLKEYNLKYAIIFSLLFCQMLIEAISLKYGLIFYVNDRGVYCRSNFYWIYVLTFTITALYLFYNVFKFSKHYQNRNVAFLSAIMTFIIIGVSLQFILTNIKVTWLTISIASIFMYIYYTNISIYTDSLTSLLNQRSYNHQLEIISDTTMVVLMDVNDFKSINDNYGHCFGDTVLKYIGTTMKEIYHKYGYCYRIGGDEFCILLNDYDNLKKLNDEFIEKLSEQKAIDSRFPMVSIGYALYQPQNNVSILDIIKEADNNMYNAKRNFKQNEVNESETI